LISAGHSLTSAAATPIVSVSSATGSIHAMILLGDQVFGDSDVGSSDIPIVVTFDSVDREERRIIEESLLVHKMGENGQPTSVNFKTVFDPAEMSALGRGELR
jgi:hypothetical protein